MPYKAYVVNSTVDILRDALDLASIPSGTLAWTANDFRPTPRRILPWIPPRLPLDPNRRTTRQLTPFPLSP